MKAKKLNSKRIEPHDYATFFSGNCGEPRKFSIIFGMFLSAAAMKLHEKTAMTKTVFWFSLAVLKLAHF